MEETLAHLFDSLNSANDLHARYITKKESETSHLEFKQKSDSRTPLLGDNDKYNFSKAISAFSNADGGLLIWGICTRKKEGRDYASALKPITKVEQFAESLRDSLIDSTVPRNHKIIIKSIANRNGNGFAVCAIPVADNAPLRAMGKDREYWVRTDGRSMRLEHYQIKDMMLRQAHPDLQLTLVATEDKSTVSIYFKLINNGMAVAKWWGYFIKMPRLDAARLEDCEDISSVNPGFTAISNEGSFNSVIHPNHIVKRVGSIHIQKKATEQNIDMHAIWYCEDMHVKEQDFSVTIPAAL